MTPDQPVVLRSRILTNSAAEFVETGAGQVIIAHAVDAKEDRDVKPPEFNAELDRFIPKAEVQDEAEYYKLFSEKISQFEDTLKSVCENLKKRKLDIKLGIDIKEPKEYRMEDVLMIAGKICAKNNDPGTNSCMNVIRKCFRIVGKHESTLTNLLDFVPTDIYGAILCGGFTLILAAVRDHENLLKDIQTGLADIPRKLDTVHRLKDAYKHQTGSLKSWADSVFLSIFMVLERIIDRLSMNLGEKIFHKVKGHGDDIKLALEALDSSIAGFQEEIECCAQKRFGRIEENTVKGNISLNHLIAQVTVLKKGQDSIIKIAENQQKYLEGRSQTEHEYLQAAVYNNYYQFVASSDTFDPVGGTIVMQKRLAGSSNNPPCNQQSQAGANATSFPTDKNKELMEKWHHDIAHYNLEPSNAIAECLVTVENLSLGEKDKVRWLMDSDQIYEWLSQGQSCVLVIEAETPPDTLTNSMSITTSLLARSLASTTNFAILSFLCGLEADDLGDEESSGPLAILKALNGQFLKFIVERRPSVDLSPLDGERFFRKSGQKFKYAIQLFSELLSMLEENDAVFILIDSFSRMPGDEAAGDNPRKDPLPNCPLKDRADFVLHLPDHVDGGKNGINIELLEQGNDLKIQKFKAENARTTSGSDDDSDDDDW